MCNSQIWIDDLYDYLKESNNKYIIFIGSRDSWDAVTSYADNWFTSYCFINDTRIDNYNELSDYVIARYNNKKPDLIITEYLLDKLPKPLKKAMANKFKVLTV